MCKKSQIVLIILSLILILNVMFVPIFDVWGGLFPSEVEDNFFDVIHKVFYNDSAFRYWSVRITISIFIPCVFMLISSIIGNKSFSILTAFLGIAGSLYTVIGYGLEKGFESSYDADSGNISIGSWIAIIIFVISFIAAITAKKETENDNVDSISTSNNPLEQTSSENRTFCPNCGSELSKTAKFCGKCGLKI